MIQVQGIERFTRISIGGVPRAGKTTLAKELADERGLDLFHTDETLHLPWEKQPHIWLERLADQDNFVVEGVQVGRILRKSIEIHVPMPVDVLIWMPEPIQQLTTGQATMAKGCLTVFRKLKVMAPGLKVIPHEVTV